MYRKQANRSKRVWWKENRPPSFWLNEQIKQTNLFVRNSATQGRLGNQLFAFGAVFGVAHHNKRNPVAARDTWDHLSRYFDITMPVDNLNQTLSKFDTIFESDCHVPIEETKALRQRNVSIGYYLISRIYFKDVEKELRSELLFKESVLEVAVKFLNRSLPPTWNGTSFVRVVIHVRRDDLLKLQRGDKGWVDLSPEYFRRAMSYFRQCYERVQFVVLSDDIEWCKKNITGPEIIYSEGHSPGEDLAVSSLCDHAIITYGTFSMWSAWFADGITLRPHTPVAPNSTEDLRNKKEANAFPPDNILM